MASVCVLFFSLSFFFGQCLPKIESFGALLSTGFARLERRIEAKVGRLRIFKFQPCAP